MTKSDKTRQISEKQRQAIMHILLGKNDSQVAEEINCSRQTVNKWKNHDEKFIDEIDYQRRQMWDGQFERLRAMIPRAVDIISNSLYDTLHVDNLDLAKFLLTKLDLKPKDDENNKMDQ